MHSWWFPFTGGQTEAWRVYQGTIMKIETTLEISNMIVFSTENQVLRSLWKSWRNYCHGKFSFVPLLLWFREQGSCCYWCCSCHSEARKYQKTTTGVRQGLAGKRAKAQKHRRLICLSSTSKSRLSTSHLAKCKWIQNTGHRALGNVVPRIPALP